MNMQEILETVGLFSNLFGFIGGIFATLAWLKLRTLDKVNEEVKVFLSLTSGEQKIELPLQMRRKDLTRAEFLGRMGMIPMREKGKRFSLRFLFTPEFITGINKVSDGKLSVLEVPCTKEEIEQFDL